MNVYQIEFNGFFEADKYDHVLAETFDIAFEKAYKLLKNRQKETEDIEIMSIKFEYEITEVKP